MFKGIKYFFIKNQLSAQDDHPPTQDDQPPTQDDQPPTQDDQPPTQDDQPPDHESDTSKCYIIDDLPPAQDSDASKCHTIDDLLKRIERIEHTTIDNTKQIENLAHVISITKFDTQPVQKKLPQFSQFPLASIKIPNKFPVWLYNVITNGTDKEQKIMMRQLVKNQCLEYYITSRIEPEAENEVAEKKYLLENYNFTSTIDGDFFEKSNNDNSQSDQPDQSDQINQDILVGRINGKFCEFSPDNWPAKKFYNLIDGVDFGERGELIKLFYAKALEEEKNKYNVIHRSYDLLYSPYIPLEYSIQDLDCFWTRLIAFTRSTTNNSLHKDV